MNKESQLPPNGSHHHQHKKISQKTKPIAHASHKMQMETSFPPQPITCCSQHFGLLYKKCTNDESTHQKDHIQILKTKSF
jgi:hypothetical protein